MNELDTYRWLIDEIDNKILELFAQRFDVVEKIGMYKKQQGIDILQMKRWNEVLEKKKQLWSTLWLNPEFIENIWNQIHTEALRREV